MVNRSVRIINITLENFKNVKKGSICLENKRKDYKSSILGLYGQNGSGKTALVDAIALLKHILCGQQVPTKYADYINVDAESAKLVYQFCTAWPSATVQAQTFSPALVRQIGIATSCEMQQYKVGIWLAPGMNIQRHPLCG